MNQNNKSMDINELMTGDLVRYEGYIYKVVDIYGDTGIVSLCPIEPKNKDGETLDVLTMHVKYLDPIPLTAEMLKANLWKNTVWSTIFWKMEIGLFLDIGRFNSWVYDEYDEEYTAYTCEHVNELQHLLRLYKRYNDANNFKVI